VTEITDFAAVVLIVAGGLFVAVALSRVGVWFPIPGPALFLIAAAVAGDVFPGLTVVSIETASRIGVVALVVILFEGGMSVGWRRFRRAWPEITVLGVVGTFGTAFVIALFAHTALDFSWTLSAVLAAALAPTDPAVMFSVLGNKEIGGRTGTALLGESGVNDPVAISLMIGALEFATNESASFWPTAFEFVSEMAVGLALGVLGAIVLRESIRRIYVTNETLYPILALSFAGVLYGVTTLAHGSGFLAVFVAGVLFGDARAPYKGEIERFHKSLSSLAEIAVFAVLGLTISLGDFDDNRIWLDGLLMALVLAFVARPVVVGLLALPMRLRWGERLFVMWGGLKGAVPIMLGTLALLDGVDDGERIYDIIFVVVAFSVLVQGTSIPFVAARLGVPMHDTDPGGVVRRVVGLGSPAAGRTLRDLPLGEKTWVEEIMRDGTPIPIGGDTVLEGGDDVELVLDVGDIDRIERLFSAAREEGRGDREEAAGRD
jgi:cell volume regulation protein A